MILSISFQLVMPRQLWAKTKILWLTCLMACGPLWIVFNQSWQYDFNTIINGELFEHSYNWHCACQTTLLLHDSLSRSCLLWPQPWSLSTIMLLWHSFLIIIII